MHLNAEPEAVACDTTLELEKKIDRNGCTLTRGQQLILSKATGVVQALPVQVGGHWRLVSTRLFTPLHYILLREGYKRVHLRRRSKRKVLSPKGYGVIVTIAITKGSARVVGTW